jgi:peroxiredoxin Q/BCP
MTHLKSGDLAPSFELPDETGAVRTLKDFSGRNLVLYFYPKDDTPGCTIEACKFRDDYSQYQAAGVAVVGISADSVTSHQKFKKKYSLTFPLLSDVGHPVCELYGVWGRKKLMGREFDGIFRTTFLIGPDGKIKQVYENVKPSEHSQQILADV